MKKSRRTYNGVHLNKKSNTQDVVEQSLTYYLYTKNNLLYTALPAVITTQYILEGKTKIGLNCLCDSLNCQSFMSDLDFYGIKYSYYEHKN